MFKELGIPNIFTMEASFCGADKGDLANHHFSTDNLMLAGRRLLESMIVYFKINVKPNIKELKVKREPKEGEEAENVDEEPEIPSTYMNFNAFDLEKELKINKQLIKITTGGEGDESSGSESEPSEDNLEKEELQEIVGEVV